MSKLSFRARALDATKPVPVYWSEEIPDLPDFAAINRAVPQMPTGMEKEEECEHHLQRAISAQQAFGHTGELVIPTPEVFATPPDIYEEMYPANYKVPRQLIHVQPFSMDQGIPDYDMDTDDEKWVNQQARKMDITPLQFEEMMDRLEKSSGQQVVTLKEAKLLLKEDDDLIIAVYDYWLNKRLKTQHPLIPQVKTEKRDGSTVNNPYVAFRRRTEKMQTRKNRKNDETSYEKMLKLRRDLSRTVTLLEMVKRREKTKREQLHLTIEIFEKRYQAGDFSGQILSEVSTIKHTRPTYVPVNNNQGILKQESRVSKHKDEGTQRKKREYTKRKHKQDATTLRQQQAMSRTEVDAGYPDISSEDERLSLVTSPSDPEDDNDPDGPYAFRRKKYCDYHGPLIDRLGNWPWCSPDEGGLSDPRYRYNLTSLSEPQTRCIGFARRRIGRGGRLLLDRAWTPADDLWPIFNFSIPPSLPNGLPCSNDFLTEIKNDWLHFRPQPSARRVSVASSDEPDDSNQQVNSPVGQLDDVNNALESVPTDFESFQSHQEELFEMQRKQLERLKQEELSSDNSYNSEHSFTSQPTSRFTLDSASAKFAVSAVLNTSDVPGFLNSLVSASEASNSITSHITGKLPLTNGPIADSTDINYSSFNKENADSTISHVPPTPLDSVLEITLPNVVTSTALPTCVQVVPSTDMDIHNPLSVLTSKVTTTHDELRFPNTEQNGNEESGESQENITLNKMKVSSDRGVPMDVT